MIASAIKFPQVIDAIQLSAFHFSDERLGKLFDVVKSVHESGDGLDMVVLQSEANKNNCGLSTADLYEVVATVSHGGHASYYQNQVLEGYRTRQLSVLLDEATKQIKLPSCDCRNIIQNLTSRMEGIDSPESKHLLSIDRFGDRVFEELFSVDNESSRSFSTGFVHVDEAAGLLRSGEVMVIAARPSVGKTSLALQVVEHFAEKDHRVLVASLEMAGCELYKRFISASCGLPMQDLKHGMGEDNAELVKSHMARISSLPIDFFDKPRSSMKRIRAAAKLTKSAKGLSLLVIDYIGLIRADQRFDNVRDRVAENSQAIKELARELDIPVLLLCQLNRSSEGQVPTMANLADSAAIERDADRIAFLYPKQWAEPTAQKDQIVFDMAKNRNGQKIHTTLTFDGERMRFITPSDRRYNAFSGMGSN